MDPILWLTDKNDNRIQDGSTNIIKVKIDGISYGNEIEYHIWNNIRGTQERNDLQYCWASAFDTEETGQDLEFGDNLDILKNGWLQIKCPTYENKWYTVCGNKSKCPIGANNTNTIFGSVNSGNFNTDINNRAVIIVRLVGNYNLSIVPPGLRNMKLVVGGSF